ncbi:hypothetical protein [Raineyella sp.]|uniref:Uncharacterized protein n=1 Tax=bioreactor metagenome TaxID=1076179 RepID=A0A644ZE41_9ZZZZ|nr:hypothetical protein [Raineyella sp.]MEA5155838.1 hypothetical protein [Raineyella sp.]
MYTTIKYLSHLIALFVVFQAAVVVWGVAEEIRFQENNPGLETPFPLGAMMHGMVGMLVIPAAALILLILALIARKARLWAGLVLASVILQVAVGLGSIIASEYLGLVHGINAFVLLAFAELAAREAGKAEAATHPERQQHRQAQPVG